MILNIRAANFNLGETLKEFTKSRLRLVLGRYRDLVSKVDVVLRDDEGHGGTDKQCAITLRMARSKSIFIQETGPDLLSAIRYCAQKAHRSINRHLGRRRLLRRRRPHTSDPAGGGTGSLLLKPRSAHVTGAGNTGADIAILKLRRKHGPDAGRDGARAVAGTCGQDIF